jgi:hypothetical protein
MKLRFKKGERGITLLETAIALPTLLLIVAVVFDLGRIYTTNILCQDVALMAAKVAVAADPTTAKPTTRELIKPIAGENGGITNDRGQFWVQQLASLVAAATGKTSFTDKELKSLNLAYGYMNSLNQKIAFPIPARDNLDVSHLGGQTNCSIFFSYDSTTWQFADMDPNSKNRIFTVECAVPLLGLAMFRNGVAPSGFIKVTRTAYAFDSGPAL